MWAASEFQWSDWDERSRCGGIAREAVSECGQRASFNGAVGFVAHGAARLNGSTLQRFNRSKAAMFNI